MSTTAHIVQPRFSMSQTKDSTDLILLCIYERNTKVNSTGWCYDTIAQLFLIRIKQFDILSNFSPRKCKEDIGTHGAAILRMKEILLACRPLQSLICFRRLMEWALQAIATATFGMYPTGNIPARNFHVILHPKA